MSDRVATMSSYNNAAIPKTFVTVPDSKETTSVNLNYNGPPNLVGHHYRYEPLALKSVLAYVKIALFKWVQLWILQN
jgi:hypothetical protein